MTCSPPAKHCSMHYLGWMRARRTPLSHHTGNHERGNTARPPEGANTKTEARVDSKTRSNTTPSRTEVTRRDFVQRAMAGATVVALGGRSAMFASLDDREA